MEQKRDTARHKPGKKGVLRQFFGQRPPSELITSDLTTYFPDHPREEIDRTARLSFAKIDRLSKVNSRLSVASNLSFASSIADAPPMPTIADTGSVATANWQRSDLSTFREPTAIVTQ